MSFDSGKSYFFIAKKGVGRSIKNIEKGRIKRDDLPFIQEMTRGVKDLLEQFAREKGISYEELMERIDAGTIFQEPTAEKGSEPQESPEKGSPNEAGDSATDRSNEEQGEQDNPEESQGALATATTSGDAPTSDEAGDTACSGEPVTSSCSAEEDNHESTVSEGEHTSESGATPVDAGAPDSQPTQPPKADPDSKKSRGGRPSGSGKTPASKADEATLLPIMGLSAGANCPCCHHGTLYQHESGHILRIGVQASFTLTDFQVEKLRCNGCDQILAAEIPPEVADDHIKGVSPKAVSTLLVMRHTLGIPNLRVERLQAWLSQVPLSDSRQWDVMREGAYRLLPLYMAILSFCADADVQILDDGWCRIIEIYRQIQQEIATAEQLGIRREDLRTGIGTTAILGFSGDQKVVAYISGRSHQGENAYTLDQLRTSEESVVRMCDAASKSKATHPFPQHDPRGFVLARERAVEVDDRVVVVHCLQHFQTQFVNCRESAPELCDYILTRTSAIFAFDKQAEELGLSPDDRMAFHMQNSGPLVEEIRERVKIEIASKTWFPKDPVSRALHYGARHLNDCTGFLRIPGCPLTTNDAERSIIAVVKHRLASLAYQTANGAYVGDISMTIAGSACLSGINPIEYIERLLEFHEDVAANPFLWLPWHHEERYKQVKAIRIAAREARVPQEYRLVHRRVRVGPDERPRHELHGTDCKQRGAPEYQSAVVH